MTFCVSNYENVLCCAHSLSCIQLFGPHRLYPTRLHCPWNFPGKNTKVGCHFLLQRIFLTQGLNPHLLHLLNCQVSSLPAESSREATERYLPSPIQSSHSGNIKPSWARLKLGLLSQKMLSHLTGLSEAVEFKPGKHWQSQCWDFDVVCGIAPHPQSHHTIMPLSGSL